MQETADVSRDGYFARERDCSVTTSMKTWMNGIAGSKATGLWSRFLSDESGQDMIEYGLIVAFIALGSVATMKGLATSLGTLFGSVGTTLTSAV